MNWNVRQLSYTTDFFILLYDCLNNMNSVSKLIYAFIWLIKEYSFVNIRYIGDTIAKIQKKNIGKKRYILLIF